MDGERLNWRDFLLAEHASVPLHALRRSATKRLGMYLSQNQLMHGDIVPDFGGLAELAGFDGLEIQSFERAAEPGKAVLDEWKNRPELKPTLGHLMQLLAEMGREDILTDCQELIANDVKFYLEKPTNFAAGQLPIQEATVSQGPGTSDDIPHLLTRQEVEQGHQIIYDAYVCFNASGASGKDLQFVHELIRRFEGEPHNLRLFVPGRDDLAGLARHEISAKIISERCKHMIVVLSNDFIDSPACTFQSYFAHSLSPGAKNKRVVPVTVEKVHDHRMPRILKFMSLCDFSNPMLADWSWPRLACSIRIQLNPEDFVVTGQEDLSGMIPQMGNEIDFGANVTPLSELPDSGCWSSVEEFRRESDVSGSTKQSVISGQCPANGAHSMRPEEQQGSALSSSPSSELTSGKQRSSSPSLGSRALKHIKKTFSGSDKRKNDSKC